MVSCRGLVRGIGWCGITVPLAGFESPICVIGRLQLSCFFRLCHNGLRMKHMYVHFLLTRHLPRGVLFSWEGSVVISMVVTDLEGNVNGRCAAFTCGSPVRATR